MKQVLVAVAVSSLFVFPAGAQVAASGSANSQTSVQAGHSSANAGSQTSVDAAAQARQQGRRNRSAGAATDANSSVAGKSANASANGNGSANIASGTTIPATLTKPVDARKAKPGDKVYGKTTSDVRSDSAVIIPHGSTIVGHVTQASARGAGQSESTLGIAFDHAVLKNGNEVPFNANIKALAAAATSAPGANANSMADASMDSAMAAPVRGGGGLLGGAGGAVAGVTGTAGGAVNGVGNIGSTVGSTVGAAGNSTSGLNAAGQLTSTSSGVFGLNGLSLNSAASNATEGSVITSAGKDVRLDSGTQMLLEVAAQK